MNLKRASLMPQGIGNLSERWHHRVRPGSDTRKWLNVQCIESPALFWEIEHSTISWGSTCCASQCSSPALLNLEIDQDIRINIDIMSGQLLYYLDIYHDIWINIEIMSGQLLDYLDIYYDIRINIEIMSGQFLDYLDRSGNWPWYQTQNWNPCKWH